MNVYITTTTTTINTMTSKTAEETYPCACCDKEMALHEVNEGCDGWVCDACVEELSSDYEEEEEGIDICGETGGLIKGFKGCGDKFDTQDTNILGNTSFCVECYNKHEDTYYKEEDIVETKTQFDAKVST